MECLARQKEKRGQNRASEKEGIHNKNNKSEADAPPLVDCQGNPTVDGSGGMILEADDSEDEREEGNPDKIDSEDKENKCESMDCVTAGLTDQEVGINTNTSFYTFKDIDTKRYSCPKYKYRLLNFAAGVHCHEIHTVHIYGGQGR